MAKQNGNAPASQKGNTVVNGAETTTSGKQQKAFITYVRENGEVSNFAVADANVVRISFANSTNRDIDVTSLSLELQKMASLQGVAIRLQRSYQAIKELDGVIEAVDETIDDLKNGVWIEGRAGEPKVTLLALAIVSTLEANGGEVDDARRKSIIEKLKATDYREKAMDNPHVKSALAQLKLDAAKKRLVEAKDAAKKAGADANTGLSDF